MTTYGFWFTTRWSGRIDGRFDCSSGLNCVALLAGLCFLVTQAAPCQEKAPVTNTPAETTAGVITRIPEKQLVESEITTETMISYGNYTIFGAAPRCEIWASGVEYSRHSWGYHLKARVDYVVEVLPFVLLSEPAKADFWGNPESPNQELVHGLGLSPFGFRFLWRSNQRIKPFVIGKAGGIVFPKKILSPNSSYANFNFQGEFGVQMRMTERVDLRLEPLVYFHVSNGYLTASNPGFDQLGAKIGISYHLGRQGR